MRVTRTIDDSAKDVESAKKTALALCGNNSVSELLKSDNLEEIENGIKFLNDFSAKCWLLSAILLYTKVFNKELYTQSGLDWTHYSRQARERLGLEKVDITNQLAAARFFIKYHRELTKAGFDPKNSNRKLARAEFALKLCGDSDTTIQHIVSDTAEDFIRWYSGFKTGKKNKLVGELVTISDKLPKKEAKRLSKYIESVLEIVRAGKEPLITPKD